jgi:acetoin utilization deacetylase AcuC-like enzyme
MVTDLVYHDIFVKHEISRGHPESPERLNSAMKAINDAGLLNDQGVNLLTPKRAPLDEVYAIHGKAYLEGIRAKSERGGGMFTMDTSVNSYTYDAALYAAGGGIDAVDRVMRGESENGFLLCRPPGHHAEHDQALGFCFINNIAVAAKHLLQKENVQRVMIVDYDAHHGNGTQNSFYSTKDVLYVGLHQDGRTLFPGSGFANEIGTGEGKGYTVNLAMHPGAGDYSYREAFSKVIVPVAESYCPEFILASVGFDGHFLDPLTNLGLTTTGFAMMNTKLREIANRHADGRLVCFLEGGYNLDVVGMCSLILLQELAGIDTTSFDDNHKESTIASDYTEKLIEKIVTDSPLL